MKKYLFILLLVPVFMFGQGFKVADFDKDTWNSTNGSIYRYDKVEHFILSGTTTHLFMYASEKHGWKYALALGFLWEVKDGFVDYKPGRREGFSMTDMSANIMGVATGYLFHKGWSWLTKKGGGGHKVHRYRQ